MDAITYIDGEWLEGNPPLLGSRTHATWLSSIIFDGARAFDIANPYQPTEIAHYVPAGAVQVNDGYMDENRIVYAVDRFAGGLYILEMEVDFLRAAGRPLTLVNPGIAS